MILDTSAWPIVTYELPESVADSDAQNHIDEMQALLDRKEAFVLIFHGTEYPKDSKLFYKIYREWGKRTKSEQKLYCRGAVRVEPDEKKRKSLFKMAMNFLTKQSVPYPYHVVASMAEAHEQAGKWLKSE